MLFGTYFFITRVMPESLSAIYYTGLGFGILAGIAAFGKGIGEIRRKENKPQAVTGIILGFVLGILPPLVWLIGMSMILMSGAH